MEARNIAFFIGQRVNIIEPDLNARVQAILFNLEGVQIQISFWEGAARKVEWVYPYEIKAI